MQHHAVAARRCPQPAARRPYHPSQTPMPGIGHSLRAARRAQGRSLADAAAETRIRESYLAALEEDEFDALGGDVYVRGFLRLYARFLGLDADALVAEYQGSHAHENGNSHALPPRSFGDPMLPIGDRTRPPRPLLVAGVAVAALAVVGLIVLGGGDPSATPSPGPQPADTGSLEGMATMPAVLPDATAASPDAAEGEPLERIEMEVVVAAGEVHLQVQAGQPPVDAVLTTGDIRVLTGDPELRFVVSDAGAVELRLNGQELPAAGAPGQAVEITCRIGQRGCGVRDV